MKNLVLKILCFVPLLVLIAGISVMIGGIRNHHDMHILLGLIIIVVAIGLQHGFD